MDETEVLIAGAGPTGLVLALWLVRQGVSVRIVDRSAGPGTSSRAMAVQARTLELYRQLDLVDEIVADGLRYPAINLWVKGERRARLSFRDAGRELTPYPFVLIYPQDRHERVLVRRLEEAGVTVERNTELLGFEQDAAGVTARFNKNLMRRANRELGADFDPEGFAHYAPYNAAANRIEMYLVSRRRQSVTIAGERIDFAPGEPVHTEDSHKYTIESFREMAARLVGLQKPDGYWAPSLLAPEGSPPETSGTGFFTYGLAWGIKAGLLDRATYEPAARRGWAALERAIQPDGRLGYVQQVSDRPEQVAPTDTQYYGTGAFLLAAAAIADLAPARR